MQKYVILTQFKATANALSAWRKLLIGDTVLNSDLAPEPIIFDVDSFGQEGAVHAYQTLVNLITTAARMDKDNDGTETAVVMVDSVRPAGLSAVAEGVTWDHLMAMLILTFQEVYWVFGTFRDHRTEDKEHVTGVRPIRFPQDDHDLACLFTKPSRPTLFDPTGLREWVKHKTNETLTGLSAKSGKKGYLLPYRRELAAAIDEENEFAFLHGYIAYRYGFRTDVVTSWSLMADRFGGGAEEIGSHPYSLLLEDMRLNFPDKPRGVHLSRLKDRGTFCTLLNDDRDRSEWRFLITTGQMGSDKALMYENIEYLERKSYGRGGVLYKPIGGIADLWERVGLFEELVDDGRAGNAQGFRWPPVFDEDIIYEGHGSPGKLKLIASTLLWRGSTLKKNLTSASELIRGAVFALDAAELLGGKTPTTTFSALTLKNEFEVRAECEFTGAAYHFSIKTRLKEMEAEVASVTRWYHEDVRRQSALEAKAKILSRLVAVFNEAGRMEEEMVCLALLRRINRKLSAPANLNPFSWLTHGLLSYGEWLLASFLRLGLLTACWVTLFVVLSWILDRGSFSSPVKGTSTVILWFFGNPDTTGANRLQVLSWFVVITGVFHIGVLISFLYSLISRK